MARRRRIRIPVGAGVALIALLTVVLAGCGGSTSDTSAPDADSSDGQTDEPSSASTVSSTNESSGETEEHDDAPTDGANPSAEGGSADLTERLLAADLPLDVLGLERSADLDPRVELIDDHFLVCPQDSADVVSVAQTDYLLAGSVIREFLIFDDDAGATAFLDSVEAANVGGCESVLEREDGPSRTATVQSFEPTTVDGADGFRWVAVQQIDMPDRAPSDVIRIQVQEGSIVVVATVFASFIEEEPDLEALVSDGLELVRSAQ